MQFRNVTKQELQSIAAHCNIRLVDAYAPKNQVGARLVAYGNYWRCYSGHSFAFGHKRRTMQVNVEGYQRFLRELFSRNPDAEVKQNWYKLPSALKRNLSYY